MKRQNETKRQFNKLPACAAEYIKLVIKKMRYRRKVRAEVMAELAAHFEDELKDCATDEQRQQKAKQLISDFGDVKLLAVLLRRAKKRCRPLWRTALVRSFQVLGIIVLYLLVCISPLLVGRPTISVNYVDWLNELVQAGRDKQDNARPYYEKATQLYVDMPEWLGAYPTKWKVDFNDVELKSLADWLEENRQAIESLRRGSLCTGYWNKYHSDETELNKGLVADFMEISPKLRRLAFAMLWQIQYEAHSGDINAALNDSVALVRFGSHLHGHGLLIENLVGIAIEALGHKSIFMLLEQDVSADVLKSAQEEFNKQFGKHEPVISMEAEKVFWYDAIQRTFTDNGQGGGRVLMRGLAYVVTDDWKDNLWRFVSFSYPDRQEVVANIDKYFERFAQILTETPWELRNETIDDQVWNEVHITPLMLKIQTPAHERISQIAWRMKTGREALLTVLAIMRYEKEKSRYPADLDKLVEAGYLKKLPMDPYSDGPLIYRRTDDGFLLYSFGSNLKDDEGKLGRGRQGKPRMWADDGDWVFWPVPK